MPYTRKRTHKKRKHIKGGDDNPVDVSEINIDQNVEQQDPNIEIQRRLDELEKNMPIHLGYIRVEAGNQKRNIPLYVPKDISTDDFKNIYDPLKTFKSTINLQTVYNRLPNVRGIIHSDIAEKFVNGGPGEDNLIFQNRKNGYTESLKYKDLFISPGPYSY